MSDSEEIRLEDVEKNDIGICPECGLLFVKSIKGETSGIFTKRGVYCPLCDSFVSF